MKSNKKQIFSIRKSHFGAASVLLGTFLVLGGQTVLADETDGLSTIASEPHTVSVSTVDEDSKELTDAKNNVDNANAAVKQQEPVVTSAANAVTKVEQEKAPVKTQLEQEKAALANLANVSTQKAEDDLKAANTKKSDAETALNNAKVSDAANQTKIATLDAEVKTANTDVENKQKNADALKSAAENSFVLDAPIHTESEDFKTFRTALEKREEIVGPKPMESQYNGSKEHEDNHKLLTEFGSKLLKAHKYTNSDTTEVNLWNLTEKQKHEINFFATDIINKLRAGFGKAPLIVTKGMFDFTQTIAQNSKTEYKTSDYKKADGSIDWKKLQDEVYKYQYSVINKAAEEKGLATPTYRKNDTGLGHLTDDEILKKYQQQQDLLYYEGQNASNSAWNTTHNRVKNYLKFESVDNNTFHKLEEDQRVMHRPDQLTKTPIGAIEPIITMGKLKELIYDQITNIVFTKGDLNDVKRDWEKALSTVGLQARKDAKFTSTIVTARIYELDTEGGNWKKHLINLFVQPHYLGDSDAPEREFNRILDPSKFDKTELKNDPTAGQKYAEAEKLLNDAIKLRDAKQNELNTLKSVPSEVAQKQADLDKAIEEVKKAEKALEDAKKLAANTEAEKKAKEQKIADLQKQYDELCAKLKAAQKTFTDETDKLNKLKQEANDADKKYRDLLAKQNQNQPKPPKGGDTGNNNGGDNGQVTPPTTGKGGNGGSNKGGGTSFTLPPLTINPGTTNPTDKETPQVSGQEQPVVKTTSSAPVATTYSRVAKNAERTLPNTGEKDSVLAIAGATVLGTFGLVATRKRKVSK